MKIYKQDFPIYPTNIAPDYLLEELSKIDGYVNHGHGNRVIEPNENGIMRPVLGEDGNPVTVDRYIIVHGSDDMDEAEVKATVDKYIADYPAYAEAKQAEYDAQDYARKRKSEYPSIEELVVALYDDDDKAAVDEKRAAIKAKYAKP